MRQTADCGTPILTTLIARIGRNPRDLLQALLAFGLRICTSMEHKNFEPLKARTKAFGVTVMGLTKALPSDAATAHIVSQLVRSSTAVGANYRASCRAKSKADFISKMAWVEEEADESKYWLELLVESGVIARSKAATLIDEADQLVRIAVASINTARGGQR